MSAAVGPERGIDPVKLFRVSSVIDKSNMRFELYVKLMKLLIGKT
jgi:hypothetical protein